MMNQENNAAIHIKIANGPNVTVRTVAIAALLCCSQCFGGNVTLDRCLGMKAASPVISSVTNTAETSLRQQRPGIHTDVSSGQSNTRAQATPLDELNVFTNTTHQFVMACPRGWTFMTSSDVRKKTKGAFQPTAGAFAFCVNDSDFDQNVNVQFTGDVSSELPTFDSVRNFLKNLQEQMPTMMQDRVEGFKLVSSAIVEMDDGIALDHTYVALRGDVILQQRQVLLISKGKAFTITCTAKKPDFITANRSCFSILINSISVGK